MYHSLAYWNKRHRSRKDLSAGFEWFLDFDALRPLLLPRLAHFQSCASLPATSAAVVDLGCGCSGLVADLAAHWPGPAVGLDYSPDAVAVMRRGPHARNAEFCVQDVTRSLGRAPESCALIVDKSLMDCLLHAADGEWRVGRMLANIAVALASEGTYVCVTQLDPRKPQDARFLTETLLPALARAAPESHWTADFHVGQREQAPGVLLCVKHRMHAMSLRRGSVSQLVRVHVREHPR
jgi:hypothetical protein